MINERDLANARAKVRHNGDVSEGLLLLKEGFQKIFRTILEVELNHDEIMALAEFELDDIYQDFAETGETFHAENPEFDDPFGEGPGNA